MTHIWCHIYMVVLLFHVFIDNFTKQNDNLFLLSITILKKNNFVTLLYSHLSKGKNTNRSEESSLRITVYFSGRGGPSKTKRNPCIVGKCDSEKRFYKHWAKEDWGKLRHLWQGQTNCSNIWKSRNIKSKRSGWPLLLNYRFLH